MIRDISHWVAAHSRLTLLFLVLTSPALALSDDDWPVYRGAWFTIKVPPEFHVRPSLESLTAVHGYDSAFFVAPDGAVQFYVFAPQWNGEPKDITLNPVTEEYVAQQTDRKGEKEIRWTTIKAKDNSYWRSLVDTEDRRLNTRSIFGITYRDQLAYDTYQEAYSNFVASLKQYGD